MHKIRLIIMREYLSRVRKKSFIIMTLLGPVLMACLLLGPVMIAKYSGDEVYNIKVIDAHPDLFSTVLKGRENIHFTNDTITLDQAKKTFDPDKYYGILYVPADMIQNPGGIILFTEKQANIEVTGYIEQTLKEQIEQSKLKSLGISEDTLKSTQTTINLRTLTLKGKESNAALTTAVGFIAGVLIYFFIFLYGVQVMRGVIEEKTNRIVEVIISSVKPFQLMMGKILGIALVGLTQFLLWIILTLTLSAALGNVMTAQTPMPTTVEHHQVKTGTGNITAAASDKEQLKNTILENLESINFPLILSCFVVYFLGGYLLYSALFAAIGAAVDSETETQQFMLPVTLPLVFSFMVAQSVVTNPDSQIGFWFSMIPLTSPVVMMVRIAFGVPVWQVGLSMLFLILGFIITTWVAARIYRTGILLYGKKTSYKEIVRWLFYKP